MLHVVIGRWLARLHTVCTAKYDTEQSRGLSAVKSMGLFNVDRCPSVYTAALIMRIPDEVQLLP